MHYLGRQGASIRRLSHCLALMTAIPLNLTTTESCTQVSLLTDAMEARNVLHAALQRLGLSKALHDAVAGLSAASISLGSLDKNGFEAAASAMNAARLAQQACSDLQRALTMPTPQLSGPPHDDQSTQTHALLEALKLKAAKVIAYARHRASAFEGLLVGSSDPSAATSFRPFWESVEKQLSRLLRACHKASLATAGRRSSVEPCWLENHLEPLQPQITSDDSLKQRLESAHRECEGRLSVLSPPSLLNPISPVRAPKNARQVPGSSPVAINLHISGSSPRSLQNLQPGIKSSEGVSERKTPNRCNHMPTKMSAIQLSPPRRPLGERVLNGQQHQQLIVKKLSSSETDGNLQVKLLEAVKGMRTRLSVGGSLPGSQYNCTSVGDDLDDLLAVPSP